MVPKTWTAITVLTNKQRILFFESVEIENFYGNKFYLILFLNIVPEWRLLM